MFGFWVREDGASSRHAVKQYIPFLYPFASIASEETDKAVPPRWVNATCPYPQLLSTNTIQFVAGEREKKRAHAGSQKYDHDSFVIVRALCSLSSFIKSNIFSRNTMSAWELVDTLLENLFTTTSLVLTWIAWVGSSSAVSHGWCILLTLLAMKPLNHKSMGKIALIESSFAICDTAGPCHVVASPKPRTSTKTADPFVWSNQRKLTINDDVLSYAFCMVVGAGLESGGGSTA